MVNTQKILGRIRERGVRQGEIAAELGIKQSTLSLKINNKRPFFLEEAIKLASILDIQGSEFVSYFFISKIA